MWRFLVMALVALMAVGCSSEKPLDPSELTPGKEMVVNSDYYDYTLVWLSVGLAEPKEAAHQAPEIMDMVKKKGLVNPNNGTKVKILEWTGKHEKKDMRKIEILEGEFKGQEGYVPHTVLKLPK